MAKARTTSKDRKMTQLSVYLEKGMDLIMPATGHDRDSIQDYIDDCLEQRCGVVFYRTIPQAVVDYIVKQCMNRGGDLDLADELIDQVVSTENYFRVVNDKIIVSLFEAEYQTNPRLQHRRIHQKHSRQG